MLREIVDKFGKISKYESIVNSNKGGKDIELQVQGNLIQDKHKLLVYLIFFFLIDLVQALAQGFSVRNKDIVSSNYNSLVFNISEVPESNIIQILGQLNSSRTKDDLVVILYLLKSIQMFLRGEE